MASDKIAQALATHLGSATSHSPQIRRSFPSKGPVVKTGVAALDEIRGFPVRLGQVVEIVGGSQSGKTQLLHLITAHALADRPIKSDAKVCWFDLNGGLDPLRLRQLMRLITQRRQHCSEEFVVDLSGLRVYHPDSTPALCAVLHKLPEFLQSRDGAAGKLPQGFIRGFYSRGDLSTNGNIYCKVDTIIIDSLGSFHYLDKQEADRAKDNPEKSLSPLSNELILTRIVSDILQDNRIVVYVSKCALFGEDTLSAPWPFPEAGIPSVPADFMPSMWGSLVSHILLIYQVQRSEEAEETSSRRAIVSLGQTQGSKSPHLAVYAAGTVVIQNEGINANQDLHVVA